MAITPDELPGYLQAIYDRVEAAAVPVAQAVGNTYKEHLTGFTLRESGEHSAPTHTPSVPGRPPAFMTGDLAGSVRQVPASAIGPGVAVTSVAPHTDYAATIQWGDIHFGEPGKGMWLWLHRPYTPQQVLRRNLVRNVVHIPSYPYMNVAVDETIADGALERAGEEAFTAAVWG